MNSLFQDSVTLVVRIFLVVITAAILTACGSQEVIDQPTTTTVVQLAPLGAFIPGWITAPTVLAMQQTYVQACADAYVMPHRLEQMYANEPFIYLPVLSTLGDVSDGTLDECWLAILDQIPEGTWIAPLAELNTRGETYAGSPAEAVRAFAQVARLDGGRHRICGAFVHSDWLDSIADGYMGAVDIYVDGWCPSIYDHSGEGFEFVARYAREVAAYDDKPTFLAQTGTIQEDKEGWLTALREELYGVVVNIQYFNQHQYAFPDGWPY